VVNACLSFSSPLFLFSRLMLRALPKSTLFPYTTLFRSGSLVAPDRLRFDFTSMEPVEPQQLQSIVRIVNNEMAVSTGEKYGEKVDRKSTRLNSSHVKISYAVFCLKKKRQRTRNA